MPYDLVLTGGEVIDPGWPMHQVADVAVNKGRIAAVGPALDTTGAQRVIDVRGSIVCPGLIDVHAHVFLNASDLGPETDARCRVSGVTTIVDGGSAGSATFAGLRHYVADRCEVRLRCFVHLAAIGLIQPLVVGELLNFAYADPEGCARTIRENRDLAIGVKLRFSNSVVPADSGEEPLRLARLAADLADVPLMVHVTDAPLSMERILPYFRAGDIVTHCLHRYPFGIMGPEQERILDAVWEAQQRGVVFDCAHGRMHFSFAFARKVLGQGFLPDTISTDLTLGSAVNGPVFDLPTTMSKVLCLGVPLDEVIRRVTTNPARVIGEAGRLGTLRPGAVADVAVLRLEQGTFDYFDTDGQHLAGDRKLIASLTVKEGRVWYESRR